MVFQFPDYETLRLAVTSGVVPPEVSLRVAVAGVDDAGRPWIEPSVKLPRGMTSDLAEFGVVAAKAAPGPGSPLVNWLQALALTREEKVPRLAGDAAVLFELAEAQQLPAVVGEMLRLGVEIGRAHV